MSLIDDLKTFLMALALGVALTLSINYVVVNYAEGPASAQAANNDTSKHDKGDEYYQTPKPVQKYDTGSSSGAYY